MNISATEDDEEGSSNASNVNNCYSFHDVNSTWHEARAACLSMGTHLLTIETPEEHDKVSEFIVEKVKEDGSFTHYYIGLRKEGGTWKWTEGETPGVTVATDDSRWQKEERTGDRDPRQVCGEIWHPKSGVKGFHDIACDRKNPARGYICERY